MRRMQRADDARPLTEQLRQDADDRRRFANIENRLVGVDIAPRQRRKHQQPSLLEIIHENVQDGVRPPFHVADGFHGRMDQQRPVLRNAQILKIFS